MCDLVKSRRQVLALAAAAGVALPGMAKAATVTALAVTCMDYRLVDDAVRFFDSRKLTNDYDQIGLAGAALAAVSEKFPSSNAAFWDQLAIAKQLHHIRKLIVLDHRDCGAYKVAFGKDFQGHGAAETLQHKQVMEQVKARLAKLHPDLAGEFWLMDLDGKAARIV